ncbi:MAG: nucleotidyltransferase domain-containing protein [Ferruginibacter sp.]
MLLRKKDKDCLVEIFSSVNLPIEVWAYGSRIKGTAHIGSDLDLVIRTHNLFPLPSGIYNELYEKIKNSNIPILVELWDWTRLPESFQKNIEHQHEILFENMNNINFKLNDPTTEYNRKSFEDDV